MDDVLLVRVKETRVRAADARDDAVLLGVEAWLLRDLARDLRRRAAHLRSASAGRRTEHAPLRSAPPGAPVRRVRR